MEEIQLEFKIEVGPEKIIEYLKRVKASGDYTTLQRTLDEAIEREDYEFANTVKQIMNE